MQYRRLGLVLCVAAAFLTLAHSKDARPTTLRVLLPKSKANVWVNGVLTTGEGKERIVAAPPLDKNKADFQVTAIWRTNNYTRFIRSKKVPADAGENVLVDLREADPQNPDRIKIRWVPTPHDVVARMCKLAKVGKEDVVYDFGCGDGRIVIAAVADFGAKKGVGVDLDAKLVAESKEYASKRGVDGKVEFREGDVLDVKDLADASVVMLYMGEDVNLRLRPILQKTLRPGARVVSHAFGMGDWKADRTETFQGDDGDEYTLYLWTIK